MKDKVIGAEAGRGNAVEDDRVRASTVINVSAGLAGDAATCALIQSPGLLVVTTADRSRWSCPGAKFTMES